MESTIPPSAGRQPPESPVPAPRATKGNLARFASRTTAATCSAEVGKTTKSASARKSVRPSDSYTSSSSGSESTAPPPTIASRSRRSSRFLDSVSVAIVARIIPCRRTPGTARRAARASAAQEERRGPGDRGGVDTVVMIEGGARTRLAEVVHAQRELGHAERRADERERVRVAVEHRHHRHPLLVAADEGLEVGRGAAQVTIETIRARDDEDAREDTPRVEVAARLDGLRDHRAGRKEVDRVVLRIPAGLAAGVDQAVAAPEDGGAVLGARRRRERLVHRLRRQSQVDALPRPVGEAAERVEENPLDLPREGRLEVGDRRQRDPHAGGDHGLVGASLGRQADAGWGRDHDELRAGVERMVERVKPARDEGIVERPDGEERRARQLAREPESAEQKEEVVLGDPELDVLARGR